jgi:hypothetical protein
VDGDSLLEQRARLLVPAERRRGDPREMGMTACKGDDGSIDATDEVTGRNSSRMRVHSSASSSRTAASVRLPTNTDHR